MHQFLVITGTLAFVSSLSAQADVKTPSELSAELFSIRREMGDEFSQIPKYIRTFALGPTPTSESARLDDPILLAIEARSIVQAHYEIIRAHWNPWLHVWFDDLLESMIADPRPSEWRDVLLTSQKYLEEIGSQVLDLNETFPNVFSNPLELVIPLYPISLDAVERPVTVSIDLGDQKISFSDARFRLAQRLLRGWSLPRPSLQMFTGETQYEVVRGFVTAPHRFLRGVETGSTIALGSQIRDLDLRSQYLLGSVMRGKNLSDLIATETQMEGVLLSLRIKRPDVLKQFFELGIGVDLNQCRFITEN